MARWRLRPARCRPLRLSSIVVLMECCYAALCQLQRTPDSACGSIVCPEEIVQYECRVPNTGSGIVWQLPGCQERNLQILNGASSTDKGMCVDGTAVVMARGSVNGLSFISQLDVNITQRLEQPLIVRCIFDDGFNEELIGTDELTSITAPVPSISRQPSTNISEIVINLDREPQLKGCSNLRDNFSEFSRACGSCIPVESDDSMIACTNSEVSGCTVTVQTIVCGVVVNESMFPIDTSQTTTSTSINTDITTSSSDNSTALRSEIIAAIVVVVVVVVLVSAGLIAAVIHCLCRRKSHMDESEGPDGGGNQSNVGAGTGDTGQSGGCGESLLQKKLSSPSHETEVPGVVPVSSIDRSADKNSAFVFSSPSGPVAPVQKATEGPSQGAVRYSSTGTDLNMLNETISAKFDELKDMLHDDLAPVKKQVSSLESQVSSLRSQVSNQVQEMTKLQSRIADLEKELREKENQHEQELEEEREKHRKDVQELQQAKAEATSELEQTKIIVGELQAKIEKLETEKEGLEARLLMQQQYGGP